MNKIDFLISYYPWKEVKMILILTFVFCKTNTGKTG